MFGTNVPPCACLCACVCFCACVHVCMGVYVCLCPCLCLCTFLTHQVSTPYIRCSWVALYLICCLYFSNPSTAVCMDKTIICFYYIMHSPKFLKDKTYCTVNKWHQCYLDCREICAVKDSNVEIILVQYST